ncbi:hypothetical protein [Xanthomonas medicagonis]|uniref:hypothetical protein n=1 Tax=Xanthomonas medicagonis TaxID=3160841 RepID=UPI003511E89E
MDLSNHSTFDWRQFPEGRARFSGGVRGIMEKQRHATFAAEVDGEEYLGEVGNAFLSKGKDYNIEVRSFGHGRDGDIGMRCQEHAASSLRRKHAPLKHCLPDWLLPACVIRPGQSL